MTHYLTPHWPAPPHIHACTSLRFGGHSSGPYSSFNLSSREPDDPQAVHSNRQQLRQELELTREPAWLQQVHGTEVIRAETVLAFEITLRDGEKHASSEQTVAPLADASFTSEPNVICAVLTADCLPLLLCNRQGTQVAAVHAGWRGLLAGVIEATLAQLAGAREDWLAWLGPAIGPTAFEVGDEVREAFMAKNSQASTAFQPLNPGKWLGNIYLLAQQRLEQQGITQIYGGGLCTYSDAQRFFSYRRDNGITGRMATLIHIRG